MVSVSFSVHVLAVEERRKPYGEGDPDRGDIPVIQYATTPLPIIPIEEVDIQLPQEQKDRKPIYGK